MSLAARCPYCETVFRLSTEQAAARAGTVRCGVCSHTFNALDYLVRASDLGMANKDLFGEVDARPPRAAERLPMAAANGPLEASNDSRREPGLGTRRAEELRGPDPIDIAVETRGRPDKAEDEPGPALGERRVSGASFMRGETLADSGVGRGGIVWGLLSVLALAVLASQAAYYFRGDLAAAVPETRPWLEAACETLGCRIEPPANIDAILIESSALEALPGRKDAMAFSALLRNRATINERFPAIELTLTDADDHPTVRRVLQPAEYLAAADKGQVGRGLAPNSELPIRVILEVKDAAVAGYRAGVFFP